MVTKNAIPAYRTHSTPYVSPGKEIVKPAPAPLRNAEMLLTKMSVPPTPYSQGNSNQRHPEHKKKERCPDPSYPKRPGSLMGEYSFAEII